MSERVVLLGLAALSALATLCLVRTVPRIEADIRDRSILQAAALGVGPTMVHVSGRDVTLSGDSSIETRLRRAGDAIAALSGVRTVTVTYDAVPAGVEK